MQHFFEFLNRRVRYWTWLILIPTLTVCTADKTPTAADAGAEFARRAAATTIPGTVTDLSVSVTGSSAVTLSFTQVTDGTGQPALYDVRYAVAPMSWGSAPSATKGTCTTPLAGTAIGAPLTCTVLGLSPSTAYNFRLVAFRGTLNVAATFGGLSNIVAASTPALTATQLTITTQPTSSAQSGVALAQQPVIQLQDVSNNSISQAGVVVTAAIASGSGTLIGTTSATTNASGVVTFTNLAITGAVGSRTLTFSAPSFIGATSGPVSISAGAASRLAITTQPSASAASGTMFAQQPIIQLQDAWSNAVSQAGVAVTDPIDTGGGTIGGTTTVTTDGSGVAAFTNLSITGSGPQTLQFTATGLTAVTSSTITITAGAASQLTITTQPSASGQSGVAFTQQPTIQLVDAVNSAVSQSGVVVTATIATGGGALGGGTTAITNASGVASFTNMSITGTAGTRTLSFNAPLLTGATSSTVTMLAGAASQLTITTQPSASAANGTMFAQQPVAQLRDASNNAVSQSGVVVTAAIATGGGTLGGTTTATTNASGVASFTNMSITGSAGVRTLSFGAASLAGATSSSITIAASAASQLTITTQPSASAASGTMFAQQPVAQLRDASNNAVSQSGVVVTAAIATGGGTLGGTTTATTNASGVASFTNMSITGSAGVRTLSFSAPSLAGATSSSITIGASAASQLAITMQPSASAQNGVAFAQQPVLQLRDASNTAVSQSGVVVTAAIATGGGTLGGTTTATTNASGVATFANMSITGTAGGRTLSFTTPGLTSAVSATITVTATTPPPSGEPVYNSTSGTLVMRDNMDEYTDATSMGALPLGTTPRLVPLPSPLTTSQPVSTTANQVIAGRDGTGKALRMSYPGQTTTQHSANFLSYNTVAQPTLATHYFQYWARTNVSGPIPAALAVKWFEAWHFHGDRIQWNTHDHLPCSVNHRPTYWQVYDKGRQTTCQGNQPVGPYFTDIIDNQWHRFTYSFRPNTSTGSRDGFARMWIDGTKVIDISAATIGVTPTGGEKPWCLADDVDALAVADGIEHVEWGSAQTTSSPAWTYDIDDFIWWTTP